MNKNTKLDLVASLSLLLAACGGGHSSPGNPPPSNTGNPAPAIASLSPSSADAGGPSFVLNVDGSGFVAGASVSFGGADLPTTVVSATRVTATVPSAKLAFAGSAPITVTNPTPGGGRSGSASFTIAAKVANGSALAGPGGSPALDATTSMPPIGVDSSHVQGAVIMNRLDLRFAADATVDQVNAALGSVGAGIVSMSVDIPAVTIGIPEQTSVADLRSLIAHLGAAPGIAIVTLAEVPAPLAIFNAPTQAPEQVADAAASLAHLLPGRFPAAWNAVDTTVFGDPSHPQPSVCVFSHPVLVNDYFLAAAPTEFSSALPTSGPTDAPASGVDAERLGHGYHVATVLAANAVGANPFPFSGCPDVQLVQAGLNLSWNQTTDYLVAHMPAGEKFVVNVSMGFDQNCAVTGCVPPRDNLDTPLFFAEKALHWKEVTEPHWPDFLVVMAAGNDRTEESAGIYAGIADASFNSLITIAARADPTMSFVADDRLWTPNAEFAALGFQSLKPTAAESVALSTAIAAAALDGPGSIASNVIVVGSVSPQHEDVRSGRVAPELLAESDFSERNPDLLTVGEDVFGHSGTSLAAPQVTGLVSLLWMLDPQLRTAQPISATKNAIVANARSRFVDAYAAVLSLDPASTPTPTSARIRRQLLNVVSSPSSEVFNEADIDEFLRHLFVVDPDGTVTHQAAPGTLIDASRYDLNGDGFTTAGVRRERFDLDRVGSTQYGATQYSTVSEDIEGADVRFDETALTDLEILCYYAYSPLFSGDTDERKDLLAGRCGAAVQPAAASLSPGETQQFTALLPSNGPVVWSATCGAIDENGRYTAGSDTGPCTVRATDANDSSISGTATVTILGTFEAEYGYDLSTRAVDHFNSTFLFPPADADASSTHLPNPTVGPLDMSHTDTYQATNFAPSTYTVQGHGDGAIARTLAGTGDFTRNAACSAQGNVVAAGDGTTTLPAMPELRSEYHGEMTLTVPPDGLSISIGGSMTRSESRATGGLMDLSGTVKIRYSTAGGPEQIVSFELRESTGAGVPLSFSERLTPPASFDLDWLMTAVCWVGSGGSGIDAARKGNLALTYSLSN
jgi:hypothetical protein